MAQQHSSAHAHRRAAAVRSSGGAAPSKGRAMSSPAVLRRSSP